MCPLRLIVLALSLGVCIVGILASLGFTLGDFFSCCEKGAGAEAEADGDDGAAGGSGADVAEAVVAKARRRRKRGLGRNDAGASGDESEAEEVVEAADAEKPESMFRFIVSFFTGRYLYRRSKEIKMMFTGRPMRAA
mmetsp:Transcript_4867/g.17659  ORF Transcript_4867/g.17659 Transcript_4867/m.17659 type:complete len:137 (-) Transcript_4867:63-473(-)